MNIKLFVVMLTTFFVTGCGSIPEGDYSGDSADSVEREDEILRQRLTIKKKSKQKIDQVDESSLNDSVIEEDLIINAKSKEKDTQKSNLESNRENDEKDDTELDDEIDHDAIDMDYREKNTSSDKNSDNQ